MRKNVGDLVKVAILVGCLLPLSVMAKRGLFPGGCRDTGYSFKLYVLMLHPEAKGDVQSLYFMHNKSGRKLKLSQMKVSRDKPYTLYLNNVIKPNKWGVLQRIRPWLNLFAVFLLGVIPMARWLTVRNPWIFVNTRM